MQQINDGVKLDATYMGISYDNAKECIMNHKRVKVSVIYLGMKATHSFLFLKTDECYLFIPFLYLFIYYFSPTPNLDACILIFHFKQSIDLNAILSEKSSLQLKTH